MMSYQYVEQRFGIQQSLKLRKSMQGLDCLNLKPYSGYELITSNNTLSVCNTVSV